MSRATALTFFAVSFLGAATIGVIAADVALCPQEEKPAPTGTIGDGKCACPSVKAGIGDGEHFSTFHELRAAVMADPKGGYVLTGPCWVDEYSYHNLGMKAALDVTFQGHFYTGGFPIYLLGNKAPVTFFATNGDDGHIDWAHSPLFIMVNPTEDGFSCNPAPTFKESSP